MVRVAGLSPPKGIEEIVDDKICQEMLDIKDKIILNIKCQCWPPFIRSLT